MVRNALLTCLVSAMFGILPASASAQSLGWGNGRFAFEGFYSHYRFDDGASDDRIGLNGVGGRLMWHLAPSAESDRSSLASRTAIGAFAVYTPEQDVGFRTWHVGTQADFRLLTAPLFGRVEPIASLGVGVFRTDAVDDDVSGLALIDQFSTSLVLSPAFDDRAVTDQASTSFALSPAFGVRVALVRNLALRGDVRDVIAFRHGAQHNAEFAAGLSVSF